MSNSTCQPDECICKRRILVVDNDQYDCADHVKCLRDWGFEHVQVAEGKGKALLENAVDKAEQHRCHLALVDMRLLDNHDIADDSGLQLLSRLKPTRTILVTAYGNMGIGVQALQNHGAVNAIGKQEGPERLRQAVYTALDALCGREMQIEWPSGWNEEQIAAELTTEDQSVDADEVHDVLVQLFPGVRSLRLEHVNGSNGTPMKRPGRRQSIVFVAHADARAPVIVKLAFAERVRSEVKNYKKYVDQRVQGFKSAYLRTNVVLWKVGGLAYALIGGEQVTSYTKRYRETQDVDTVLKPLREHFCETWCENYGVGDNTNGTARPTRSGSLLEIYYNAWAEELQMVQTVQSMETLLHRWQLQMDTLALQKPLPMRILNPYRWLAEHRDAAVFPHLKQAIIHGDLHGNNILVDTDNHPWIIDFDRTRCDYLLFDMTEIMQYLFTRIAELHIESPSFYELAVALADLTQPSLRLSAGIAGDPQAHKAHGVLDALRTTAAYLEMYNDEREMLWGLLLEAVFVSLIIPHDQERIEKLILLSGIICQRLEKWPDSHWIPTHWPAIDWLDA